MRPKPLACMSERGVALFATAIQLAARRAWRWPRDRRNIDETVQQAARVLRGVGHDCVSRRRTHSTRTHVEASFASPTSVYQMEQLRSQSKMRLHRKWIGQSLRKGVLYQVSRK